MKKTNEIFGMSVEQAIIEYYNIDGYIEFYRYDRTIVEILKPIIDEIFSSKRIPMVKKYVGKNQNNIDFLLKGNLTLSIKTNIKNIGKVAPQIIGQSTSNTFFIILSNYVNNPEDIIRISNKTYIEKIKYFKGLVLNNADFLLKIYWQHLFECDYLLHLYNFNTYQPKYYILNKLDCPNWNKNYISFTRSSVKTWNESTTIKYHNISIGEFQVHNNRDCFKFRFNMKNILSLIKEGMI